MARAGKGLGRALGTLLIASAPATGFAQAAMDAPPAVATPATPNPPATTPPAAQAAPSTPATPGSPAAPASPPATPPAPATSPAPPDAPPPPPATGEATPDKQPPDTSISQTLDLPARTAAVFTGKSSWDEGFKSITDAFAKLDDAIGKNGLVAAGHPLAVFTATDDNGFSFSAEVPIEKAPEGKTEVTPEIKIGQTPGGKAMRFQHRGSYEEIDSTYEAITAYLDEKGLESRNLFAEEYLDKVKSPDDVNLEVDIYVFLK